MKAFIKSIMLFFALLIGLILLIEVSTDAIIYKFAKFKLMSTPKYIILGHSHPECAYNDTLIHNFKNLAQSGESYYYTYFKVKKILEQNPSLEAVFIEYTNNQINYSMNNWIWGDKYISNKYANYAPFIPVRDQFLLMQNNLKGYLYAFSYANKHKIATLIRGDYNFTNKIGGYLNLVRNETDSLLKCSNILNFEDDLRRNYSNNISETNLLYLRKIIQLVKKYDKKVFLIRSPQHPQYSEYKNETIYKRILEERFSDVEYLDFSHFPLSDSAFGDLEHLNYKGAAIFSTWFDRFIKDKLL
jgi:hypothetical protein